MIAGVMSHEERHKAMEHALSRKFPVAQRTTKPNAGRISIVCYGPSLRSTWNKIPRPMITVSGAHDFMVEREIFPDFHVECDPREHKVRMLERPQRGVTYLMASCCHPSWWPKLEPYRVKLWHLINGNGLETLDWLKQHDPEHVDDAIGGGSTVGMRAMNVAAVLMGYRKFDVFGMDGSYETDRHAGTHTGDRQIPVWVTGGGGRFRTTPQLAHQAVEMRRFLESIDAEVSFYGSGLIPSMAKVIENRKRAA